jgi:hypothetical protein
VKNEFILDPLWITKGTYLDAEYFNYVLLDASLKYKKEIEADNINRFYEVLFHMLNLNNLAVNGNIFTAKFKEIWKNERIKQIQDDLKKLYDLPEETADIFKNANYVFLNLIIDYMKVHLDILGKIKLFHMNEKIHLEKEIFVVTNKLGTTEYRVWKFTEDRKRNFGYTFSKVRTITVPEIKKNAFSDEIERLEDPKLKTLSSKKNVCFAVIQEDEDERLVAKTVKDTLLLNKGIAKKVGFEPLIIAELYQHVWLEKMMPFTLDQWKFENA